VIFLEYNGINRLARVVQGRTNKIVNNKGLTIDLGTIQEDYSLLTDSYDIPIPAESYLILENLSIIEDTFATTESAGDPVHTHTIKTPEKLKAIKPSDRVLVNWVGSDAIVVGKIMQAKEVKI